MRVVVARIGRALGLRGDVLVDVRTDEPERRLCPGAEIFVGDRVLRILTARDHSGRLCLHFEGVDDRTSAESLTGALAEVDRALDETPDDPDEFYDDVLTGMTVVTLDGEALGEVSEVLHLPGQDVLAVRRPEGDEVLVPFVSSMVPEVDVAARRIVVAPPPGLIEELPDPDEETPAP